jgi:hypothetical protein
MKEGNIDSFITPNVDSSSTDVLQLHERAISINFYSNNTQNFVNLLINASTFIEYNNNLKMSVELRFF